jgi:cystathionine gamma-synthase
MTHAAMDATARAEAGLTDGLLRMSVGIEELADLQEDMREGLARISPLRLATGG